MSLNFNAVLSTTPGDTTVEVPVNSQGYSQLTVKDMQIGNTNMPLYVPNLLHFIAPHVPKHLPKDSRQITWFNDLAPRVQVTDMYFVIEYEDGIVQGHVIVWDNPVAEQWKPDDNNIPNRRTMLSNPFYHSFSTIKVCELITEQTPIKVYPTQNGFTFSVPDHKTIYMSPELAKMFLGCSEKIDPLFYKLYTNKDNEFDCLNGFWNVFPWTRMMLTTGNSPLSHIIMLEDNNRKTLKQVILSYMLSGNNGTNPDTVYSRFIYSDPNHFHPLAIQGDVQTMSLSMVLRSKEGYNVPLTFDGTNFEISFSLE